MPPRARCARSLRAGAPRLDGHGKRRPTIRHDVRVSQAHSRRRARSTALHRSRNERDVQRLPPKRREADDDRGARSTRLNRHFRRERARTGVGERCVDTGPAVFERSKGSESGQFAAANREPQAVAGHRIDEAGGVAGEQQTVDSGAAWRRRPAGRARPAASKPRAGEAFAQHRIVARSRVGACVDGSRKSASTAATGRTTHTLVSPPGTGATPM